MKSVNGPSMSHSRDYSRQGTAQIFQAILLTQRNITNTTSRQRFLCLRTLILDQKTTIRSKILIRKRSTWLKMHLSPTKVPLKTLDNTKPSFKLVPPSEKACHRYKFRVEAAWKLELIAKADRRPQGEILEELIDEYWDRKEDFCGQCSNPPTCRWITYQQNQEAYRKIDDFIFSEPEFLY